MGFFENVFDPRAQDWGQLQALKKHDGELGMLDDDLHELKQAVKEGDEAAHERVTKLRVHFRVLRTRLNRVELVAEALFMHLESQGQIDRKRLLSLMEEIDARDGEADGRAKKRST